MDLSQALARSGALKLRTLIRSSRYFPLTGGLDVMDPPNIIPPGMLIGCLNFEPGFSGGYRRMDGYEALDGHASPSDSAFTAIAYTNAAFAPAEGETVTESGSGITGTVAYLDASNQYVVVVAASGTFVGLGSTLTASGGDTTPTSGTPYVNGGPSTALANTYWYQKWVYLKAQIGPVGGALCSGKVLAVMPYGSTVYAIRNNAAGSAATLWKATTSGWQQVDLGIKLRFDTGVYSDGAMDPVPEGTLLTGGTSGATFTVRRVASTTGTWGTDAAGYLVTDAITGTPTAGETFHDASSNPVLNYLSHAAQALPPDGTYEWRVHNFLASEDPTTGFRLYGVNGVGNGFEFDGTTFVLIETGMTTDTPDHLEIHSDHLFYSFPGGSLQNSGYQLPLSWNPVFGADARSVGQDVKFMREMVNGTMVIGTDRNVWTLTGLTIENFQLLLYAQTGALSRTDANVGQLLFGEPRGITAYAATQAYGDFRAASMTDKILSIVNHIGLQNAVGAVVTRKKNLYRLFFSSGDILNIAINATGKWTGWTQCYLPDAASCVGHGFTGDPLVERTLFADATGYVYEMDKGRSFNGQKVAFFLKMAYWHLGTPDMFKRFRKAQVDILPEGQATVNVGADCNYGQTTGQTSLPTVLAGGGGLWDVAYWDNFNWDSSTYQSFAMKLDLTGYNVSLSISGEALNDVPFTLNGVSYQYSDRVINRNTAN